VKQTRKHAATFDPNFGTALQAVDAIRGRVISSRELTSHVFERIKKHNPTLNLFVTLIEEQAMARARQADEMLAKRKWWGIRTTSGSKMLERYTPKEDAVVVARLKAAGAIIVGTTNLPEFAGDWQSFNGVAGTSNNPWDVARTPGGSTGGSDRASRARPSPSRCPRAARPTRCDWDQCQMPNA